MKHFEMVLNAAPFRLIKRQGVQGMFEWVVQEWVPGTTSDTSHWLTHATYSGGGSEPEALARVAFAQYVNGSRA